MLTFLTGLLLGSVHVVSGPDHLAAVAPLARERGARVGAAWGSGHALGVGLVALALWWIGQSLDLHELGVWGERAVGISLIAVGVWSLRRPHVDRAVSATALSSALAIGLVHGVAGGSHLYAALPALALSGGVSYLVGFGLGAIAAMVVFAGALGRLGALLPPNAGKRLRAALSVLTVVVGVAWLLL